MRMSLLMGTSVWNHQKWQHAIIYSESTRTSPLWSIRGQIKGTAYTDIQMHSHRQRSWVHDHSCSTYKSGKNHIISARFYILYEREGVKNNPKSKFWVSTKTVNMPYLDILKEYQCLLKFGNLGGEEDFNKILTMLNTLFPLLGHFHQRKRLEPICFEN